jgi:hypothetical protein
MNSWNLKYSWKCITLWHCVYNFNVSIYFFSLLIAYPNLACEVTDAFSTGTPDSSHTKGQTLPGLLNLCTAWKIHHLQDSSFFIHGTITLSTNSNICNKTCSTHMLNTVFLSNLTVSCMAETHKMQIKPSAMYCPVLMDHSFIGPCKFWHLLLLV